MDCRGVKRLFQLNLDLEPYDQPKLNELQKTSKMCPIVKTITNNIVRFGSKNCNFELRILLPYKLCVTE